MLWPKFLLAERQSASLEIRATVPSYCKFKVDNSFAKNLELNKAGEYKVHIATIDLDCNIISGYQIVANSNSKFNLTSTKTKYAVPYELVINTLGDARIVNETSRVFAPEISTKAKQYEVFLKYKVDGDVMAGEYSDNIEFALDLG